MPEQRKDVNIYDQSTGVRTSEMFDPGNASKG